MNGFFKLDSQDDQQDMNRRRFLGYFSLLGLSGTLLPGALAAIAKDQEKITTEMISQAEKIAGLQFTEEERREIVEDLNLFKGSYEDLRNLHMPNSVPLSLYFNPIPPGKSFSTEKRPFRTSKVTAKMPSRIEDLAFYPVTHLAKFIRARQVTSTELTAMYLARLKKYDPLLKCVITLTEDLAMKQAQKADQEMKAGKYRGILHGIPWGVKDVFSTKGYKTTWGASVYKDQMIDDDATVVKKLEDAGAVLVAKLSVGELATGDKWFGGKTRNPWKPEWGSGGSSAGPASAVAAGLVGFSIGTETTDSLVGPARVCGATALRPSFGQVSRHGVMTVSWSFDKIGPICRSVEDCAVVFKAISGPDHVDHSVIGLPFNWDHGIDIGKLRVGFVESYLHAQPRDEWDGYMLDSYKEALKILESMDLKLVPLEKPSSQWKKFGLILVTEAAAAHDELTLSNRDELLTNSPWAKTFRMCRFIPAVEYIQANRARTLFIQEADKIFDKVDLILGRFISFANLLGFPEVVIPNGFNRHGTPESISFTGRLFGEEQILALADVYQNKTGFHLKHPKLE